MKPKLKDHVFYAPTDDGVLFKGPSGTVVLQGRQLYDWVEKLVPYLQGSMELEALLNRLTPERRQMVHKLVMKLVQHGFVKDASQEDPHTLTDEEMDQYRSSIRFIDEWQTAPHSRFQAFRRAAVLVVGHGAPLVGLVRSLCRAGLQHLALMTDEFRPDDPVRAELEAHRSWDPTFTYKHIPYPDQNGWGDLASQYSVIAAVGGDDLWPGVSMLTPRARSGQFKLITGWHLDGRRWVGPVVQTGASGCPGCVRNRLAAAPAPVADSPVSAVSDMLLGQLTGFEVFKLLTGVMPASSTGAVMQIQPERLTVSESRLPPWPDCSVCGPAAERDPGKVLQDWQAFTPLSPADAWKRAEPFINPHTGLLSRVDLLDLVQIPLSQCTAEVRLPGVEVVCAAGRSHDDARYHALIQGLLAYSRAVEERYGSTRGAITLAGRLLPDRQIDHPAFAGGHTMAEWVGRGLLSSLEQRWTDTINAGTGELISLRVTDLEPWVHLLWKAASVHYGVPLNLFRVRAEEPGTVLVFASKGRLLGVVAERSPALALEAGLVRIVHALQRLPQGEPPEHWLQARPPLRLAPLSETEPFDSAKPAQPWSEWTEAAATQLAERGLHILVRPATADLAVAAAGVLTGWVGYGEV